MWKLKIGADGKAVLDANGLPIYIKPDGSEVSYDVNATTTTIANLQAEAKTHRTAKEAVETKLAAFGDLDPTKTKEALAKYKDVDLSKMIDAGKLDEVRKEITTAYDAKMAEKDAAFGKLQGNFHKVVKQNVFGGSQYIKDKLIVPADMIALAFGDHIKINDDTGAVTFERNGMPIQSADKPGEIASADEAIAELVKTYPHRDAIMKGNNNSGSGSQGGGGGNNGAARYTRAEFAKMSAGDQMRISTVDVPAGKAVISD